MQSRSFANIKKCWQMTPIMKNLGSDQHTLATFAQAALRHFGWSMLPSLRLAALTHAAHSPQ
jgi:hypothetical protein